MYAPVHALSGPTNLQLSMLSLPDAFRMIVITAIATSSSLVVPALVLVITMSSHLLPVIDVAFASCIMSHVTLTRNKSPSCQALSEAAFAPRSSPGSRWHSLFACLLQGAFMAALYSQGLAWEQMHHLVREYARQMSSVQHLLWDLTLPIMSIFNGVGFDRVVRETFKHGAQQIEDLWLRFASLVVM